MNPGIPTVRDVVLLGGGHSHVIVIRKWAMQQIPGVQLSLISESAMTPYSGMLPGLVAGHYTFEESHIDLNRLCRWAGVHFIQDRVVGLEPDLDQVLLKERPSLGYDVLSIDTGGAPRLDVVDGAREFTTPVKPVSKFWSRWQQIEARARHAEQPLGVGVVGGGAGGFEILLAMQHRLATINPDMSHEFHWLCRSGILPDFNPRVQRLARQNCLDRGVDVHEGFDVVRVKEGSVHAASGTILELDEILWCTEAAAAPWPRASGLDCDDRGFIKLNDSLQSVSHPKIFAAGDVAIQVNHPRPRAGVFAVRQGPPLFENLQRAAIGRSLQLHRPQSHFLTLLSLGQKSAIAQRGPFSVQGDWVWRWKDWIDQRFMGRFNALPDKPVMVHQALSLLLAGELDYDSTSMRCGGCGAKVAGDVLRRALDALDIVQRDDVVSGLGRRDDVAVIDPGGKLLAQSVDQLKSMLDDHWLFARIATQHALSDLYAGSAVPQSAMLLLGLPFATDTVTTRRLRQLLDGVVSTLNEAGCALSGGHTSETAELTVGLVVNGFSADLPPVQDGGRYSLILTKPLGIGVIMAADMRGVAPWRVVGPCIDTMLGSNEVPGRILAAYGATRVTDITGFGLVGHLLGLLRDIPGRTRLSLDAIPALPGAIDLDESGARSSLYPANARNARYLVHETPGAGSHPKLGLLFDPQTSGGLLGLVPEARGEECVVALQAAGMGDAVVIGSMISYLDGAEPAEQGVIHVY